MSKRVLITGASGLLGRQVKKAFEEAKWDVTGTALTRAIPPSLVKLDLRDGAAIEQVLDQHKPDVVVHCAAQRFPDRVDKDPNAARALNVDATSSLARATAKRSILLIYVSTDYVFPGTEGEAPYEASDEPKPPNLYGQLKRDGEVAVFAEYKALGEQQKILGVVLRVPVLYGPVESDEESAVTTLLTAVWKAQKEKVVMDAIGIRYPTHTEDVARVCKDIATKYLSDTGSETLPSILQFSSEDRFTKYTICETIAEILGIPMGLMEKQGNDPNASVKRPFDCHLSTKALKDIGVDITTQDFVAWWRWRLHAHR